MRVREQLVRIKCGNLELRLWLHKDRWQETRVAIEELLGVDPPENAEQLAEQIADHAGVSAVQITDDTGEGPCIYPSWP